MRCPTQLAVALAVYLPGIAVAEIGPPTVTPVPIPAGTLITNGGATLDNYVSQDLFVNTTADWTAVALRIELIAGSIYQDTEGENLQTPAPSTIILYPSVEFDSYLTGPEGWAGLDGGASDLGGGFFQFDMSTVDATWDGYGIDTSNIGSSHVARLTLSDDAQGTWSLAATEALNPQAKFLNNPIANGQLIVDPMAGDLNYDGFVGIEDLNPVLSAWNQSVTPGSVPDPSDDGFVGVEDLNVVLGNWNAGIPPRTTQPTPLNEGDVNSDGLVGIDDLNIVYSHWHESPPTDPRADPSGDFFVGIEDWKLIESRWYYGQTPPAAENPVPEPLTFGLIAIGLSALSCRRV